MVDKKLLSGIQERIFVTIFVSTMLSAAIIIPEETDKNLIDSLQRIDGIEWNGFSSAKSINGNLENAIIFSAADILPLVSDLLIVLDPAYCTFEYLSDAIRHGCHLFLPEQFNLTIEDRKKLIYLSKEGNTLIQVKNDFIFQPLNKKILSTDNGTCFIEVHQSTIWKKGKLREKILNNLLLIILSCGAFHKMNVFCGRGKQEHPDVINIHINFMNGSTASFTMEFSEQQDIHQMKIFNKNGLDTFDFIKSKDNCYVSQENNRNDYFLAEQIDSFIRNIQGSINPLFGLTEELEVHLLMEKIKEKFDLHFCDILK